MPTFVKLSAAYVKLDQPIPFSIYDAEGKLLLVKGQRLHSESQLERLIERGVCVLEDELQEVIERLGLSNPSGGRGGSSSGEDKDRVFAPSKRLSNVREHIKTILFEPETYGDQLVVEVQNVAQVLMKLVDEDQDRALYLILRGAEMPHSMYSVSHATNMAIMVHLLTHSLEEYKPVRLTMMCAALTKNISITELQGILARQHAPITDEQREEIRLHPIKSHEILEKGGVTDSLWLSVVLDHHEKVGGGGYPNNLSEVSSHALMIQYIDVLLAKLSARARRKPVPANKAMKDFFLANRGANMAEAVVKAFGIYPPGTFVKLKNGDTGVVLRRGKSAMAPQVLSMTNASGEAFPHKVLRDSSEDNYAIISLVPYENVMLRLDPDQLYRWR